MSMVKASVIIFLAFLHSDISSANAASDIGFGLVRGELDIFITNTFSKTCRYNIPVSQTTGDRYSGDAMYTIGVYKNGAWTQMSYQGKTFIREDFATPLTAYLDPAGRTFLRYEKSISRLSDCAGTISLNFNPQDYSNPLKE